jgi:uncharacterized protein YggE
MKGKLWRILTVVAVLLAASWLLAAPAPSLVQAQDVDDAEPMRTVSVSGTGQASAMPDLAVVSLGVQTQDEEASTALSQNNEQMQAVIDALEEAGVESEDIQTQVIRLSPRYEQPRPQAGAQQGPPELVGFVATNIVEVTVRDISGLGDLLDAAIQAGGNQIQGIRFQVADPAELVDQAREAAWEDAMNKADQLAALSGSELGVAWTINESSRVPRPVTESVLGAGAAAAVPIEPGTQLIEVDLQVTWLLTAPKAETE